MLFFSGMGTEYQYQFDDPFRKIEQLEAVVRSQQQTIEVQQQTIEDQQQTMPKIQDSANFHWLTNRYS